MPKVRQNQIGESYTLHCKQFINDLSKRCNANEVDTETLLLAIDNLTGALKSFREWIEVQSERGFTYAEEDSQPQLFQG